MIKLKSLLKEGPIAQSVQAAERGGIRPGDKVKLVGQSFGGYHVQGKSDSPAATGVKSGAVGTVVRLDGDWAIVDFGHYESARVRKSDLQAEALSQQKFAPRSWSANQSQYDWRTQKKGDHWKSHDGKWGARAQSGEVDYFPDEETAKRFAQHSHTGRPGTYVSGQFKEAYEPDKSGRRDSPIITPAAKEGMVNRIRAGSRVTIVDRFGKKSTGKAVMRGPAGWVLNMGGRYGTPAIASAENVIAVKESVKEADQDYSGPEYAEARKAAQKLLGMLSPADRKAFLEWLKSRKLAREKGLVEPD